MKTLFVFALALGISSTALAGAWGAGSFDNDDALDWVNSCTDMPKGAAVTSALTAAVSAGYLEAPDGAQAIAAAEVLAAALGSPGPRLPQEARQCLDRSDQAQVRKLAPLALKAMLRVRDQKVSELAGLWSEAAKNDWLSNVQNLEARLKTGASTRAR